VLCVLRKFKQKLTLTCTKCHFCFAKDHPAASCPQAHLPGALPLDPTGELLYPRHAGPCRPPVCGVQKTPYSVNVLGQRASSSPAKGSDRERRISSWGSGRLQNAFWRQYSAQNSSLNCPAISVKKSLDSVRFLVLRSAQFCTFGVFIAPHLARYVYTR